MRVTFLLPFEAYGTANLPKGTSFTMEQGGELAKHMTASLDTKC